MKIIIVYIIFGLSFISAYALNLNNCGIKSLELAKNAPWSTNYTRMYLTTIYNSMAAQGKIHMIAAGEESAFKDRFSKKTYGFYIPSTHQIYIDPEVGNERCPAVLLHELIHAFQYSVRLPYDINLILKLVEAGEIVVSNPTMLLDLLSTYYEVQAHYYTMMISPNPSWMNYLQSFEIEKEKLGAARSALSMPAGLISNIFKRRGNRQNPEQVYRPHRSHCGQNSELGILLTLCELYFSDNLKWVKYPANAEYRIHKHIAEKVNASYGFSFGPNDRNQKIFTALHNQFENIFISVNPLTEYSKVDSIHAFNEFLTKLQISPFNYWLTEVFWSQNDTSHFLPLSTLPIEINRLRYWAELIRISPSSLFIQGPGGQEGSSRQLLIQPNFEVFP